MEKKLAGREPSAHSQQKFHAVSMLPTFESILKILTVRHEQIKLFLSRILPVVPFIRFMLSKVVPGFEPMAN